MGVWGQIAMAAVLLMMIFFLLPGVKASVEASKHAKKDWKGILIPVGMVVLFVIFLLSTV